MFNEEAAKSELESQKKEFQALAKLKDNSELKPYFDLLLKTSTDKMLWTFIGNNVKSWEDFCIVRGEIVSRLQPIQEVYGAQAVVDRLNQQLKEYFVEEN